MKITTWNVNSINARVPNVKAWLEKNSPDILLMQELKCESEKFPKAELENLGYQLAVHGQKAWNGVAIASKYPISDIKCGILDGDEQSRYIEAEINNIRIASLYLPNGNPVDSEKFPYKLKFMDALINHAEKMMAQNKPYIIGGDFNIIPEAQDCYDVKAWENDALYKIDSRKRFRALLHLGFTEAFRALHPIEREYTFWDYQAGAWPRNNGLRIDHFLLSPQVADRLKSCYVDKEPRGQEKASDHTPLVMELN